MKLHINTVLDSLLEKEPILLDRHKFKIQEIYSITGTLKLELESSGFDLGIITNCLENLAYSLEELIGIVHSDDVLDNIFSNFCIGK